MPFPGVVPALDNLLAQGATLSVCTNKRTDLSFALLKALGLTHYFKSIVGADAAPAPKPDAAHLLTAIEAAGGDPKRAIMVGDSASDAGAARAAGDAADPGGRFGYTETPVEDLGADLVVNHFDKIPAACAELTALFARP